MFRLVLGLIGIVGVIVALPLLFTGGSLVWVDAVLTDADGFIRSSDMEIEVDGFALIAGPAEIDTLPETPVSPIEFDDFATIRIEAENLDATRGVFVGVADTDLLDGYLATVPYAVVSDLDADGLKFVYREDATAAVLASPNDQAFWNASAHGVQELVLEWDIEPGDYTLVVMNEDASDGLSFRTSLGIRVPVIQPIGITLVIGGVVALALGTLLLALAL